MKSIAPTEARDSNSDWGTSKWKEIEEEERLVGAILTKSLGDAAQSDIEVKAKLPKLTLKVWLFTSVMEGFGSLLDD